jgi:hypothetical protein
MKNIFRTILVCLVLSATSCSLEEINPHGSTVDKIASTVEGYEKLISSCYFDLSRYFYGRNLLLVTEGGTDIWTSDQNSNNNQNYLKYASGGTMPIAMANDYWVGAYDAINYCNIVIGRVNEVQGFKSDEEKNAKVAEAHFLRALYYFHLVEQFGPSVLTLEETKSAQTDAYRTEPLTIYEQAILPDLRFAAEHLPVLRSSDEAGRPVKKSALGLLAKALLQTKQYGTDKYMQEALDTSKEIIDNAGALNVLLYSNFADNFNEANNKNNKEALYQLAYSQAYGSTNTHDHNNDFKRFYSYPTTFGAVLSAGYQLEVGRWSGGTFMPSKYLLDVFVNEDGTIDPRYALSFQTEWTANTNYSWTSDAIKQFDRTSAIGAGTEVKIDEVAIKFKRDGEPGYTEEKDNKLAQKYIWVDINDVYGEDNAVKMKYTRVNVDAGEVDNPFIRFYPSLTKFNNGSLVSPRSNSYTSDASATVMRMGEVYLIAAEAEFHLNGATGNAANYINALRNRVGAQLVDAADISIQFILDERARELCGEYTRWYDLKRSGKLTNAYLTEKNPDVGKHFIDGTHGLRPIPQRQMDAISNPNGFQNPGY